MRRFAATGPGFAVLFCAGIATAQAPPPDFAPSRNVGWIAAGAEFIPPPSGPGPVMEDPTHPHIFGVQAIATHRQGTVYLGDPAAPILQPWASAAMKKHNEAVLAGKDGGETRPVSCWPMGVPSFLLYPMEPIYFVQTAKEVLLMTQQDFQVRHIYMNVPHSRAPKPSWYGESVGRYEGDTLVVDTIGLNLKTYVDNFRTPHTGKLHVVEHFRLAGDAKTMEVEVLVDDAGAFTTPWRAIQRYRRADTAIVETACAENVKNFYLIDPIPMAAAADF